jgi:DNA-binding response OmpR family regulator
MTAAVLLAEPEPAIRGYLEWQLQSDGFHVHQAAFGGEALVLAERTRPDLVLCSELDCARGCARASPAGRGTATCR